MEYLLEIILRRHENRSTIEESGKLLGDVPAAGAILDRFLHRAEVITITGRSYRLKDKTSSAQGKKDKKEKGETDLDSTAGGAS